MIGEYDELIGKDLKEVVEVLLRHYSGSSLEGPINTAKNLRIAAASAKIRTSTC
jgi:hypothetical protein